jgi:hypothetical protein
MGYDMKKTLLLTTALTLGATSLAFGGGLSEPISDPVVIEAETNASSASGIVVPLLLLLVVAAAVSGGSGGGGGAEVSDMRLKEDITRVGTTHLGLPLYHYRYRGLPAVWEGVMAQDVEIMHPNAIKPLAYGYKSVDYAALGLTMRRIH